MPSRLSLARKASSSTRSRSLGALHRPPAIEPGGRGAWPRVLAAGRKTRVADEQSIAAATDAARPGAVPAASLNRSLHAPAWPSSARRRRLFMSSVHTSASAASPQRRRRRGAVAVGSTVGAACVNGAQSRATSPGPKFSGRASRDRRHLARGAGVSTSPARGDKCRRRTSRRSLAARGRSRQWPRAAVLRPPVYGAPPTHRRSEHLVQGHLPCASRERPLSVARQQSRARR